MNDSIGADILTDETLVSTSNKSSHLKNGIIRLTWMPDTRECFPICHMVEVAIIEWKNKVNNNVSENHVRKWKRLHVEMNLQAGSEKISLNTSW